MYEFNLEDPQAIKYAQEVTASGGVWGGSLDDRVYVLVGRGWSSAADSEIRRIKGGERGPVSAWLPLLYVPKLLDVKRVMPATALKLRAGSYAATQFGGLTLLRYPVRSDWLWKFFAPIPPWMLSQDGLGHVFQQFSFEYRNEAAFALQKACQKVAGDGIPRHLPLLMATSMNYSGDPTIVNSRRAHAFCLMNDVELLIHRGDAKKRGSYPRLYVGANGNVLQRWENCSREEIANLLASLPGTVRE